MADLDQEVILEKKGPELFRELKRLYPGACVEDYYANSQWKDEVMAVDWQLVKSHRQEAGAEDPPALEDVKMPVLPKPTPLGLAAGLTSALAMLSRPGIGGVLRPTPLIGPSSALLLGSKLLAAAKAKAKAAAAARMLSAPKAPGTVGLVSRPNGLTLQQASLPKAGVAKANALKLAEPKAAPAALAKAGATAAGAIAVGPVQELRQIALFVAKWRLDPTRTKMMLAKLGPIRRRYVIQQFKNTGGNPTDSLQQYVAQCEQANSWPGTAGTLTPMAAGRPGVVSSLAAKLGAAKAKAPGVSRLAVPKVATTAVQQGGLKRPWTPATAAAAAAPAAKFQRLMTAGPKAAGIAAGMAPRTSLASSLQSRMAAPKAGGAVANVLAQRRLGMAAAAAQSRPGGFAAARPAGTSLAGTLASRIASIRARAAQSAGAARPSAAVARTSLLAGARQMGGALARPPLARPALSRPPMQRPPMQRLIGSAVRPTGGVRPAMTAARANAGTVMYGGVMRQAPAPTARPGMGSAGGWGSGGARPMTSSLLGGNRPRPMVQNAAIRPGAGQMYGRAMAGPRTGAILGPTAQGKGAMRRY